MLDYRDKTKAVTAEDLIRRYNLEDLSKYKKTIQTLNDGLTKTDKIIENYVINLTKHVTNQNDHCVTAWFFSGAPTLENNPFINFTEEELSSKVEDFYYDKDTGYVYQLVINNGVYSWNLLDNDALRESLAIANNSADTNDNKRNLFYSTPTPPYEVGDIWYDNGVIKRCRASRSAGDYNSVDWCLQSDYTDANVLLDVSAILDQFIKTVETDYVTNVLFEATKESINSSVSSVTTQVTKLEGVVDNNAAIANNNYQDTLDKMNGLATSESVVQVTQAVETLQTSTQASINVINETLENGVPVVKTNKGFTFSDDGLIIDETNSPTKSNLDTDGLTIIDKTGGINEELLFSGYDNVLMQSIVRTANLLVRTYLMLGNNHVGGDWRVEIFNDDTYGLGVGFFYMGDD